MCYNYEDGCDCEDCEILDELLGLDDDDYTESDSDYDDGDDY